MPLPTLEDPGPAWFRILECISVLVGVETPKKKRKNKKQSVKWENQFRDTKEPSLLLFLFISFSHPLLSSIACYPFHFPFLSIPFLSVPAFSISFLAFPTYLTSFSHSKWYHWNSHFFWICCLQVWQTDRETGQTDRQDRQTGQTDIIEVFWTFYLQSSKSYRRSI